MPSAKSMALSATPMTFFFTGLFLCFPGSYRFALCSLLFNDSIRPRQHVRRDNHADRCRRLEIDHQLEFCTLLDGSPARSGSIPNLIAPHRPELIRFRGVASVGHPPAVNHK